MSTKKQQEQGYSLKEQEQAARAFASSLGQELRLYTDAESGSKNTRKDWQRLLADLESATSADVLWYGSQSRLSRDVEDFAHFRKLVQSNGIQLFEKRQNRYLDFRNKGDRIAAGVTSLIDEEENTERVARIVEGMTASWQAGNRTHNRIYGYRATDHDPKTGKRVWTVVPDEAELVKYIYNLYVNKRLPVGSIIRKINAEGYRNREGKPWVNSLHRLLTHSIYAGLTWNADRELIKSNLYEPIISEKLFREALSRHTKQTGRSARGRLPAHLAVGFLRCPKCGSGYKRIKRYGRLYYLHGPFFKCDAERKLLVYDIANFVLGEAFTFALSFYPDDINKHLQNSLLSQEIQLQNDIIRMEGQLKKKKTEVDNLNKAIATGVEGAALANFVAQVSKRLSEIKNLEREKAKLEEKKSLQSMHFDDLVASLSIKNLFKYYNQETADLERRELLKPLISKAVVFKDSITVELVDKTTMNYDYPDLLQQYKLGRLVPNFLGWREVLQGLPEDKLIKQWAEHIKEMKAFRGFDRRKDVTENKKTTGRNVDRQ